MTSARARSGTSRRPAVPAAVPPPRVGRALFSGFAGSEVSLPPGVLHVPDWLDIDRQRDLVRQFREWALPPAGLRQPRVPSGHVMSVQSVCLGWHWQPYRYSRTADDTDGMPVKPLPASLAGLAAPWCRADAAILNLYPPGARLGLHQDAEEPASAPVVTVSLGDACVFRFAGVTRRTGPFVDLVLSSGDLLVFGGPSRRIYHGVPRILEDTGPDIGLPAGRLSITLRETGLS